MTLSLALYLSALYLSVVDGTRGGGLIVFLSKSPWWSHFYVTRYSTPGVGSCSRIDPLQRTGRRRDCARGMSACRSPPCCTPAKALCGSRVTSDVTPGKLYVRYLEACDRTEVLRKHGTKISIAMRERMEKNLFSLDYQTACNAYIWRENRAAALTRLLEAAEERERINMEAVQSHAVYKVMHMNIAAEHRERKVQEAIERLDALYPPYKPLVQLDSAERADALYDIKCFDMTPYVWVGLKRRRLTDEPPEPCDSQCDSGSCGMCEYCKC